MGTTPNRHYPYPESTDPPNGPVQFRALADAVDADMVSVITSAAKFTGNIHECKAGIVNFPDPEPNQRHYIDVTFDQPFAKGNQIMVFTAPWSAAMENVNTAASSLTATGCAIGLYRTTRVSTSVFWLAISTTVPRDLAQRDAAPEA